MGEHDGADLARPGSCALLAAQLLAGCASGPEPSAAWLEERPVRVAVRPLLEPADAAARAAARSLAALLPDNGYVVLAPGDQGVQAEVWVSVVERRDPLRLFVGRRSASVELKAGMTSRASGRELWFARSGGYAEAEDEPGFPLGELFDAIERKSRAEGVSEELDAALHAAACELLRALPRAAPALERESPRRS